jgi:hypothetical protein
MFDILLLVQALRGVKDAALSQHQRQINGEILTSQCTRLLKDLRAAYRNSSPLIDCGIVRPDDGNCCFFSRIVEAAQAYAEPNGQVFSFTAACEASETQCPCPPPAKCPTCARNAGKVLLFEQLHSSLGDEMTIDAGDLSEIALTVKRITNIITQIHDRFECVVRGAEKGESMINQPTIEIKLRTLLSLAARPDSTVDNPKRDLAGITCLFEAIHESCKFRLNADPVDGSFDCKNCQSHKLELQTMMEALCYHVQQMCENENIECSRAKRDG